MSNNWKNEIIYSKKGKLFSFQMFVSLRNDSIELKLGKQNFLKSHKVHFYKMLIHAYDKFESEYMKIINTKQVCCGDSISFLPFFGHTNGNAYSLQ